MKRPLTLLSAVALLLVIMMAAPLSAQAPRYDACGVLVQGPNCVVFRPLNDPQTRFELSTYQPFGVGDSVCVQGTVIFGCQTSCVDVVGCIQVDSITVPTLPSFPLFSCGVLVEQMGCLLFAPGGDPFSRFYLSETGGYGAGDTVAVFGTLTMEYSSFCPGVFGCVAVDSLQPCMPPPPPSLPGRAIMRLATGDSLEQILASVSCDIIDSISTQQTYLISFDDSIPVPMLLAQLRSHPGVLFAEPDFATALPEVMQMSQSFPDEQAPAYVEGVSPSSYYQQPASSTVDADSAHSHSLGDGIKVAVIDNGISFLHPLFEDDLASTGYDYLDDDADPSEEQGQFEGHGTFVAGLIKLTAPGCQLIPLRAFGGNGVGTSWAIVLSIYHAIGEDADVINMSFGFHEYSYAVMKACSTAVEAGISLVAAVGNDSSFHPTVPASFHGVTAVSALDTNDAFAHFSNYGNYVDVSAPGVRLYSALSGPYLWGTWSGTSFSAALTSGICALTLAATPGLTSLQVESRLRATAEKEFSGIIVYPPNPRYGFGKVDALNAVLNLSQPNPTRRGDVDHSGTIDVADCVYLISYVFGQGPAPEPIDLGDADCSDQLDISDVVSLIAYIFGSGPPPVCR